MRQRRKVALGGRTLQLDSRDKIRVIFVFFSLIYQAGACSFSMAIRDIVVYPDDRLRLPTTAVTVFDEELQRTVEDMFESMYHYDGIGLAAPQIGLSKRIIVIDIKDTDEEGQVVNRFKYTMINPEILEKRGTETAQEGCLSVPEIYEEVTRAAEVKVKYQDEHGEEHELEADGILAVCIQHEIDHLQGHLFIDYLSTLKRSRINKKIQKAKKEKQHAE